MRRGIVRPIQNLNEKAVRENSIKIHIVLEYLFVIIILSLLIDVLSPTILHVIVHDAPLDFPESIRKAPETIRYGYTELTHHLILRLIKGERIVISLVLHLPSLRQKGSCNRQIT